MIVLYNMPLSLLISLYSKLRYGEVISNLVPKMPLALVFLGIAYTSLVGYGLITFLGADAQAVKYAVGMRSWIYFIFRY